MNACQSELKFGQFSLPSWDFRLIIVLAHKFPKIYKVFFPQLVDTFIKQNLFRYNINERRSPSGIFCENFSDSRSSFNNHSNSKVIWNWFSFFTLRLSMLGQFYQLFSSVSGRFRFKDTDFSQTIVFFWWISNYSFSLKMAFISLVVRGSLALSPSHKSLRMIYVIVWPSKSPSLVSLIVRSLLRLQARRPFPSPNQIPGRGFWHDFSSLFHQRSISPFHSIIIQTSSFVWSELFFASHWDYSEIEVLSIAFFTSFPPIRFTHELYVGNYAKFYDLNDLKKLFDDKGIKTLGIRMLGDRKKWYEKLLFNVLLQSPRRVCWTEIWTNRPHLNPIFYI